MTKQESGSAKMLYQMEQERQALDARKAALDAREAVLDARDGEQREKAEDLERREKAVRNLEEQKEEVQRKQEAIRKKEEALDEAVKAVTEMPTMDAAVEYIMDHATIEIRTSPESPLAFPFVARRYLDYIRSTQKKRRSVHA